jgi:hypothetical protein
VNVKQEPAQKLLGPDIVAVGSGLTVNVIVLTGVAEQPVARLVIVPKLIVVVLVGQTVNVLVPLANIVSKTTPPGDNV